MLDIIILLTPITELLISTYALGLGLLVSPFFFKIDQIKYNLNEVALFGFCLILPIVQIINIFFPITPIFFYLSFFFSILIILKFRNQLQKKFLYWLLKLALILILLIPLKYVIKGNEDLYYHLPKIEFINNFNIIFGIAHFDYSLSFTNGWAYISSAFNFLNGAEKNLYLSSFVFYILSMLTFYNYLKQTNQNKLQIFLILIISFLLLKFYRIQEFGNDYQAIILLFFSQFLIFQFYLKHGDKKIIINKILFYSCFAILFRIYSLLIIPTLFIIFLNKDKFLHLINKKLIFILFLSFSITSITSFLNSGCFFMPLKKTCVSKNIVSWSYIDKVDQLNLRLKSFNTSYFGYKKNIKNPMTEEEWTKNLNWASYHFQSERFILPMLKTLFLNCFLFVILVSYLNKKKFKFNKLSKNDLLLLFFTFLSFSFWMFYTPLLRAGGYSYWTFLILSILILSFNFQKFFDLNKIKKYLILLISITVILNLNRIYKESEKYSTLNPFFFTEWGKLHHMKYQDKERLISYLKNKDKLDFNFKINKSNKFWVISGL